MKRIVVLNNTLKPCGIQQWGERLKHILRNSSQYAFIYREATNKKDVINILNKDKPEIVLYNYHPSTLFFVTKEVLDKFKGIKHVAMVHEGYPYKDDYIGFGYFIYLIKNIDIDPSMSHRVLSTDVRYLLPYTGRYAVNKIPTIGSFGFGFPSKRFDYVAETVNNEFDEATLRLHISKSIHGDPNGDLALAAVAKCKAKITKPGIRLVTTHNFMSDNGTLDFLAGNDINCFFYDDSKKDGIAGSTDLALSVRRPLAVTKVPMFSHLYSIAPSICIEDNTLKSILKGGVEPLLPIYDKFSFDNFNKEFSQLLDAVGAK